MYILQTNLLLENRGVRIKRMHTTNYTGSHLLKEAFSPLSNLLKKFY